jgi:hypothetical protein
MPLSFLSSVPDEVLDNPNSRDFLGLLDALNTYKRSLIDRGNRFYNPVLLTDTKFLVRYVNELGFPEVPISFPKIILDNLYLGGEDIMALMGSRRGLEWLLRALTCGAVTIDDSRFYPVENYIVLSDVVAGFMPASTDVPDDVFYLFNGVSNFTGGSMVIHIATPFYNFQPLLDYINTNIKRFVGFVDEFNTITITFVNGPYVKNPYMYPYFSNVRP